MTNSRTLTTEYGKARKSQKPAPNEYSPPKHELESLARCLYPAIIAYFESEQGQREFTEWQERQRGEKIKKGAD
jgi:hypothetical protein